MSWSGLAALRNLGNQKNPERQTLSTKTATDLNSYGSSPLGSLSPLQGCSLNCTATVPTTGQGNTPVQFQASADPSNCATQPIFEWNFGDGTARSNQQNPAHAYANAGTYNWTLTTSVSTGANMIETIAGGLGEGIPPTQAPFGTPVAITRDSQGRGLYVVDTIGGATYIRFINTSGSPVTLAGTTIAPGTVRYLAGGGVDFGENALALQADLGIVAGLGISADGNLLYFANQFDGQIRALNLTATPQTIGGVSVGAGRIGTLAGNFGTSGLNGIAVNPSNGDVYTADGSPGINKVFKIDTAGNVSVVAGNGAVTQVGDAFGPGLATNIPLLLPRSVALDGSGNIFIADTGHGRVIRVDAVGNATLVNQFTIAQQSPNPYPSGLVIQGGNLYSVNGNRQTVTRLATGSATVIAGTANTVCDYSASNCGDGGPGTAATFNFLGSTASPPLAGIEGDNNGLFLLDQGLIGRGRIRYLNLSGGSVTIAGVTIPAGAIDTIAGNGAKHPYDGPVATGATFSFPVGVATDANGNLWVADTVNAKIRFVNRGINPITIFPNTDSAQTVPAGGITTVNKDVGVGPTDGVAVIQAGFDAPQGLFITSQGIYVADSKSGPNVPPMDINGRRSSLVRFINTSPNPVTIYPGSIAPIVVPPGQIAKIAGGGDGAAGNGNGAFALNGVFIGASDVAVAPNGTIYVTDVGQKAVRRIDPNTGVVTSLALGQAQYTGLGLGPDGRLYIANFDGNTVLRENSAGGGTFSTMASGLVKPRDVAVGSDGTAYVTVSPASLASGNHQIVQITSAGAVSVIAGSGGFGFGGDGGPASAASINIAPSSLSVGSGAANNLPQTVGIVVGQGGELIFTDTNNHRIRRISAALVTCVKTGTITISGDNPVPQLTSIDPASALLDSGGFMLTVTGSNFTPTSKVRWNGQDRTTVFASGTSLTATIPGTDLATAGTASVTVFNPAPGGGTSNALNFTIIAPNPVPSITSISPTSAIEGGAGFTLTVNGAGFVNNSVVRWDGQARPTTFVNSGQLTAEISSAELVGTGQASVTVFNPTPGGGASNNVNFTINAANSPTPTLSVISPNTASAGGPAFTLTATGTNFTPSTVLRWNGQDRATNVQSSTELKASITAADIATVGTAQVTVFTPAPGGGVTSALTFTISPALVVGVSAASFLGGNIAPDSIVAAFGVNMAPGVQVNTTLPLPTSSLGTSVKVKDANGVERDSGLFFVAPGQINFLVPKDTAPGVATLSVVTNGVTNSLGQMTIAPLAPGLFSANSNGVGVAAAVALRIRGSELIYESFSRYDAGIQRFVPVEVDLGPVSDQVFLVLFGTGSYTHNGLANVTATVGNVSVPVTFADKIAGFEGLDQINVGPVPRSMIGAGLVDIILRFNNNTPNPVATAPVQVQIK